LDASSLWLAKEGEELPPRAEEREEVVEEEEEREEEEELAPRVEEREEEELVSLPAAAMSISPTIPSSIDTVLAFGP